MEDFVRLKQGVKNNMCNFIHDRFKPKVTKKIIKEVIEDFILSSIDELNEIIDNTSGYWNAFAVKYAKIAMEIKKERNSK